MHPDPRQWYNFFWDHEHFDSCCLIFHLEFIFPKTCISFHISWTPLKYQNYRLKKDKTIKLTAVQNWRYWAASYSGYFKLVANFLQWWWCSQKQVIQWRLTKRKVLKLIPLRWVVECLLRQTAAARAAMLPHMAESLEFQTKYWHSTLEILLLTLKSLN